MNNQNSSPEVTDCSVESVGIDLLTKIIDTVFSNVFEGRKANEGEVPLIVCMVGLPQSGKTAVAEALPGFQRISEHDIEALLLQELLPSDEVPTITNAVLMRAIGKKSSSRIVVDGDYSSETKRSVIEIMAKNFNAIVAYIVIGTNLEIVKARQNRYGADYNYDPIYRLKYAKAMNINPEKVTIEMIREMVEAQFLKNEEEFNFNMRNWPECICRHYFNLTEHRIDDFKESGAQWTESIFSAIQKEMRMKLLAG